MRAEEGNLTRAARRLGIAKSTLYAKIRALGREGELATVRGRRAGPESA